MSEPIVEIEQGKLKGKVCKTPDGVQFYSFKGIPYAKPPVGDLRFSIPQPPENWEGVRDATQACNICAQFDKQTQTVIGDEDCLFLNVYTPKILEDDSPLPVIVYLHGGGYLFGNGTDDASIGPEHLIEKDVIVVSINYRLGILGFLSLDCKEAPGNMGLRDQVEALRWVQKNISRFGGDSNNVTIQGVSAGAASVHYLLLSPLAKGLFHKAIAQSGSSLLAWAHESNIRGLATSIGGLKGKPCLDDENLLKLLKDLPTKDLIMAAMTVLGLDKFRGGLHFGFVPTIEKPGDWVPFIDKSTYDLLSQGEFMKVPLLTGFCTREALLLTAIGQPILDKLIKEKNFLAHLPLDVDETEKLEVCAQFKSAYLDAENKYNEPDDFAINFFSDVDFTAGTYLAASMIAKKNAPVYFYEFSYDGKLNYLKSKYGIDRKGACHGDEGGYLVKDSILPKDISETDKLVRERMVSMWTSFAKYGDPTPKTNDLIPTKWESCAETGMTCLLIDHTLTMKHEIYPERMKIYEDLYKKYYNKTIQNT